MHEACQIFEEEPEQDQRQNYAYAHRGVGQFRSAGRPGYQVNEMSFESFVLEHRWDFVSKIQCRADIARKRQLRSTRP